jgi:hypothetical protein
MPCAVAERPAGWYRPIVNPSPANATARNHAFGAGLTRRAMTAAPPRAYTSTRGDPRRSVRKPDGIAVVPNAKPKIVAIAPLMTALMPKSSSIWVSRRGYVSSRM